MARSTTASRPGRSLIALCAVIGVLYGIIAAGVVWSDAQWTPKLALDLEGGTEIVLTPVLSAGEKGTVTSETLSQAVDIIRQRIDSKGISEAEITTQGNKNIIVSIPGRNPDAQTVKLVEASAQMQFRAVIEAATTAVAPTPTPSSSPTATPSGKATATGKATASPSKSPGTATQTAAPIRTTTPTATPSGSQSSNGKNFAPLSAPRAATTTPTPSATLRPSATATPASKATASPLIAAPAPTGRATATPAAGASVSASPTVSPTSASDPNWAQVQVNPPDPMTYQQQFTAETCTDLSRFQGQTPDPKKPFVTCSTQGTEKYLLGPAEVLGTDISGATAGIGTNGQGNSTGEWEVDLSFDGAGTKAFADVTTRLAQFPKTDARNRFAIVLDGVVISAPTTNERIPGGQARISGSFDQASAQSLANQLKFGALPVSFKVETSDKITATLGSEDLRIGLIAGAFGLFLVVVYSLFQYRALGFVTIASLVVVGIVTYGLIVLLSWRQGYRLSLAGVAGLIVSIGITADSFIVYFERVRDEVRDGQPLQIAVEAAWHRARRTIVASDSVSFLAAVVLFTLAVGGVRGFAFTLGLTTLVDILVVFLFTKPMVTLLSRRKFFASGHKLSGFDAVHLGRSVAYTGRGRVRPKAAARPKSGQTIAERRAAAEAAAAEPAASGAPPGEGAEAPPDDDAAPSTSVTGGGRGGRDA